MPIDPDIQFYMKVPIGDGTFTNGRIDYTSHPKALGIDDVDLSGKRVLDIATNDGFWAFWADGRGAEDVIGIDVAGFDDYDWGYDGPDPWRRGYQAGHDFSHQWDHPRRRFEAIRDHLGSHARYEEASVYDLDPSVYGQFDLVFNYGLLYHLRHPLLSLDRVRSVTRGALVLESHVVNFLQQHPVYLFYERDEFREPTNWTGPTEAAVATWLRSAGFHDIWVRRPRSDVRTGRTIFVAAVADPWRERFEAATNLVRLDDAYFATIRRLTQRLLGEHDDD